MKPKIMKLSACLAVLSAVMVTGADQAWAGSNDHGVVFYCDGAGGGGLVTNWGRGVQSGLKKAGYQGKFEEYVWETGLGVLADQKESVAAKKAQAAKLASKIVDYARSHPDQPIHIMGLSAGTAIVAYTLEALPESVNVQTAFMLSGSLSSGHDLTKALRHVRGDMYVTTSTNDAILHDVVPITGTADRKSVGDDVVGVNGCRVPAGASAETRRLYSKVMIIAWNPSFARYGDSGGHTDTTKPRFIQHVIAPLVMRDGPRHMHVHPKGSHGAYRPGEP